MRLEKGEYDNIEYYVIESENDFCGWSLIKVELFLEGAAKIYMTRITAPTFTEMIIAFCSISTLKNYLKLEIEKLQRFQEMIK